MKRMKRGTALILAGLLLASLPTTALVAAGKNWVTTELGALSQYYETGNSADPGYISTVKGDSGGVLRHLYVRGKDRVQLHGLAATARRHDLPRHGRHPV